MSKKKAEGLKKPSGELVQERKGSEVEELDFQRGFFNRHRLGQAQIPRRFWNKTLENFEARDTRSKRLVQGARAFVQSFNFAKEFPQGLMMSGPVGCGKSHLAVAILCEVIKKGYSGLYYNSPDLLLDIRATFDRNEEKTEEQILDRVSEVDLLVLDDLGAENISGFVLDRFYLIVNRRYEGCKPIIVTTNLEISEVRERLGDRIVSRLFEMTQDIGSFPDQDYRRRHLR